MPISRFSKKLDAAKQRRRRSARARRKLYRRLALEVPLYPPQQGSRRPEWSSRLAGEWASIRGVPE